MHVEIMNWYSISPINPFWVRRRISNNGVTIQHYLLLHKDRIRIKAYFPLQILKAGNTLVRPFLVFFPQYSFGSFMPFAAAFGVLVLEMLSLRKKMRRGEMRVYASWYIHLTSIQPNQKSSQSRCKGGYSKHYAMVSEFHNARSHSKALEQGSYTTDLKQPHPG